MKKSRSQTPGPPAKSGKTRTTSSRSGGPASKKAVTPARNAAPKTKSAATRTSSAGNRNTSSGERTAAKSTASAKAPRSGVQASRGNTPSRDNTRNKSGSTSGSGNSNGQLRGKKTSAREGLHDVLKDGLKDIYYAEKQLVKALKKMSKAAHNEDLQGAFETHREQTETQVEQLEKAFDIMGMRAAGKKCPAMDGLIEESKEHIEKMDKGPALDAALIVGAQKVEHYEIAAYGSLRAFAKCLDIAECEQIFDHILQQESETDHILTEIADAVNREALAEHGITENTV